MLDRLLVLLVAALLVLPNLGAPSLWDIDEGLNAEAAREMVESGNWIVPHFNYQPRTAKPALLYWWQAAAYRSFGVTEFAARLPSAVATVVASLLVGELGRRMFGRRAGLLAGVMYPAAIQVCVLGHAATPDAMLLVGVIAAMLLFWAGYTRGGGAWLWWPAAALGWATLAKGPVGLALPALVGVAFLATRGELRRLFDRRLVWGVLIFCAVAVPWYALVGAETRGAFLRGFLMKENVDRFLTSQERHGAAWWLSPLVYPAILTVGFAPWSFVLFPTLGDAWKATRAADAPDRLACRFLLIWLVAYLAFFTLAATKLPNYIAPLYAPLTLLAARLLDRRVDGLWRVSAWWWPLGSAALFLAGCLTFAGFAIASGKVWPDAMRGNGVAGLFYWGMLGGVLIAAACAWMEKTRWVAVGGTVGLGVLYTALLAAFPARLVEERKAVRKLVADAGMVRLNDETRVGTLGLMFKHPSLVFYCQRGVTDLATDAEAAGFLRQPFAAVFVVTTERAWERLAPLVAADGVTVLATADDLYLDAEKDGKAVVVGRRP